MKHVFADVLCCRLIDGLEQNRHITCGMVAETANNFDLDVVCLGGDG